MFSENNNYEKIGKNISSVISDNLERSGLFIPVDEKAFIQSNESLSVQPRFEDWKVIKAQHLIAGKILGSNGKITVEFRLYDVFQQKQIVGRKYETNKKIGEELHILFLTLFLKLLLVRVDILIQELCMLLKLVQKKISKKDWR